MQILLTKRGKQMKTGKLNKDYFDHKKDETFVILGYKGSSLYRIKFANGETTVIGKSSIVFN